MAMSRDVKIAKFRRIMQDAWNKLQEADDFVEGSEPVRELQEKLDEVTDEVARAIKESE